MYEVVDASVLMIMDMVMKPRKRLRHTHKPHLQNLIFNHTPAQVIPRCADDAPVLHDDGGAASAAAPSAPPPQLVIGGGAASGAGVNGGGVGGVDALPCQVVDGALLAAAAGLRRRGSAHARLAAALGMPLELLDAALDDYVQLAR